MDRFLEALLICRSQTMFLINICLSAQSSVISLCGRDSAPNSVQKKHLDPSLPMTSRQPEVSSFAPSGPLSKMSLSVGMSLPAFSYDDALEDLVPMTLPPSDMGSILWKPVIPEYKYQHLDKTEEGAASVSSLSVTSWTATDSSDKAPVMRAKAFVMNSLITKPTQENIQHFEQQAGLRDVGYTPYKGLTTEEMRYLRVAEELHKLKLKSGETAKEEKHPASAQSPGAAPLTRPLSRSPGAGSHLPPPQPYLPQILTP